MTYFCGIGGTNRQHAMANFVSLCCMALLVGLLVYGLTVYRGAPIRRLSDGTYRDKGGRVFTERQYVNFRFWELCYGGSFVLAVAAGVTSHFCKGPQPPPPAK
jgi:hypothetical protein